MPLLGFLDSFLRGSVTKSSNRSLLHGRLRTVGHKISFSHKVSLRTWYPNIQCKTLYSNLLNVKFRINVTTKALKCIDRAGGFDNYLLYTKPKLINSDAAMKIKGLLVKLWEGANKRPYRRSQFVYEIRLKRRYEKGYIGLGELTELINESRKKLADKKKWRSYSVLEMSEDGFLRDVICADVDCDMMAIKSVIEMKKRLQGGNMQQLAINGDDSSTIADQVNAK